MENIQNDSGFLIPKKSAYFSFILLFLLYLFDYADRMIVTSLFPYLIKEWGLSDTQCGLLVSAVYWSIVVFTFPVSLLVDRWSRKKSVGIMAAFWCLATAACAFTGSFATLFVARVAIGIGEAGYAPGGTAMISGIFPLKQRSFFLGIWNASIPLGAAIGTILGGYIAQHYGWRHAFGVVAVPGLIIAMLFFFVKDYETVELDQGSDRLKGKKEETSNWKRIALEFLHTKSLLFTFFGFAANTLVTTSLLTFLPTFFNRVYRMEMVQASNKSASILLMALIGAPLGGYLADKWLKKRADARLLFSGISSIITGILLFSAFYFTRGNLQYIILLASGITAIAFVPSVVAVTQDVVHPGVRAISCSLAVIVQNLLGSAVGPVILGRLSDLYSIETAMTVLPVFSVLAGLLFLIGNRYYLADVDNVAVIALKPEH